MNVPAPIRGTLSFFARNYLRILIVASVSVTVSGLLIMATRARDRLVSDMEASKKAVQYDVRSRQTGTLSAILATPSPADTGVLGAESDGGSSYYDVSTIAPLPTLIPLPTLMPTFAPLPTFAPQPAATPLNCAGTANEDKSQVYLSSNTAAVGASVTVSVELRDCNNNLASNDNLAVSQQTNDQTAKLNGQSGSINIQAVNGKASFTVSSQTAGTVTLVITDTNQNFPVTMPGYHNPSVTFSGNSSGNANCTTAAGIANFWYSVVHPNSPMSANGSIELTVDIKDCNKNLAPVSDSIRVSLTGGDPNTRINGNAMPYTATTQNGQVKVTVSSQVSGTVNLNIRDTTNSFDVTDDNNRSPSITFAAAANPTPTTAPANTPTPTLTPAPSTSPPGTTSAVLRRNPA